MDTDSEYRCVACGQRFETHSELERHVHQVGLVD
jgi:DNA-directed RNA polymerase subunit RPC12/RpoP